MSKVYPVTNRVILIPDPVKSDEVGGLIIPDDSKELPNYATVYSAGPLCTQVKEGDRVIYPHKYGSKINIDGKEHLIMKEADLWAVVEHKAGYASIPENILYLVKKILTQNPECSLSGSLGLIAQGVNVRREPVDIDIYLPYKIPFKVIEGMVNHEEFMTEEDYENEEYERTCYKIDGVKVDVMTPVEEFIPAMLKTFSNGFNCISRENIIKFKILFSFGKSESKLKHKDDVIHILKNN